MDGHKDYHTERSKSERERQIPYDRGFPGGAVVRSPPANAGDGFESWSGRIPHAVEQLGHESQLLSPHAATTDAHAPRAHAPQQQKPPQ